MSKINNVRLPNASTGGYDPAQFNQLVRSLEQIVFQLNNTYTPVTSDNVNQAVSFYEGGGNNAAVNVGQNILLPNGSFYSTQTQSAAAINTAYAVTLNSTVTAYATYVGTPTSRVYVDVAGVYNFEFSLQLDKTAGSTGNIWVWPRINGTDIPNSATRLAIQGTSAEVVAAWNFLLDVNSGDYFELMWAVDDTRIQIVAEAATAFCPAIPSAILTATYESALG
jgi:hypothetical protein